MNIEISARTILKIVLVVLSVFFVYVLRDVIFILLFSTFIATAVSPLATWFAKRKVPRLVSVLVLYVIIFSAIIVLLSLALPIAIQELNELTQALPNIFSNIPETGSARYLSFVAEVENFLQTSSDYLAVSSGSVLSLLIDIFGGLISFISIIVISFYFSVMERGVVTFLQSIVPKSYDAYASGLWMRAESKVGGWIRGQLFLAILIGVVVYIGLTLLHIKYALLLGVIAMVLELIPYVGPVMSSVPALILAFLQSPALALWVLLFYLAVQQVENHFLTPLILGKSTGLHPVSVIVALLIGGKLAGMLGILLAVPVAVILVEVFEDLAAQRQKVLPK